MSFKLKGLDKFSKELNKLSKNAEKISGNNQVSFNELFTNSFMSKYTDFTNIDDFVTNSGFDFSDLESIPDSDLDNFVSNNTSFSNWKEMLTKASEIWTVKKLGL